MGQSVRRRGRIRFRLATTQSGKAVPMRPVLYIRMSASHPSGSQPDPTSRFERLEEALMFTDRRCEDLATQVLTLSRALERAERRIAELEQHHRALALHTQEHPGHQPPPGELPLTAELTAELPEELLERLPNENEKPPHW